MQSMKSFNSPSLGARRMKHGSGHRTTWAMWSVAVLLAILAAAFPLHKSASADGPSVTITASDPNYETATATIEATGITFDDWILDVDYVNLGDHPYSRYKDAGPGLT